MSLDNQIKNTRFSRSETLNALHEIKEKYKQLPSTDIMKFAAVYYPIAIIEMNLEEMTFEDFETVQLDRKSVV